MKIVLNGDENEVRDHISVAELVESLGLRPERLAVEVNRKIIRRVEWGDTRLLDGDRIEVVHFVGGGEKPFLREFDTPVNTGCRDGNG